MKQPALNTWCIEEGKNLHAALILLREVIDLHQLIQNFQHWNIIKISIVSIHHFLNIKICTYPNKKTNKAHNHYNHVFASFDVEDVEKYSMNSVTKIRRDLYKSIISK